MAINKKQLNEISLEDLKNYKDNYGHLSLDVAAVVASAFPGIGSAVSFVADISNALWYLSEDKPYTAAMYGIMAIPGVGDILAIPIQTALHAGGRGMMKIPKIAEAFTWLVEHSQVVEKYFAKLGNYSLTAPLVKEMKVLTETLKKGGAGELEKEIVKESLGKRAKNVVTDFMAEKAVKATISASKRVIPKMVSGAEGALRGSKENNVSASPDTTDKEDSLRKNSSGSSGRKCPDDKIKYGCRGDNVKTVQKILLGMGYKLPRKGADGWFGPETKKAVMSFQTDNGIKVDGVVGEETIGKMENPKSKKTVEKPIEKKSSPENKDQSYTDYGEYLANPEGGGAIEKPDFSKLKENLITRRNRKIQKLVFERLIKNANRS